MPTYSYACTECANRFDAVQAFTDDALTTCPQCSGRLRKLFGSVGVVFKGSGFYRNDSRPQKSASESSSDDSSSGEKKTGADSPSDKPAAAKADSKPKSDKVDSKSKDGGSPSSAKPAAVAS